MTGPMLGVNHVCLLHTAAHPSQFCSRRCGAIKQRGDNWDRAREAAHANLLALVQKALIYGPRQLEPENVHVELAALLLPRRFGFEASLLTPDIIALDEQNAEVLVIEGTICPEPALPRYIGRKRTKYHQLCARATPETPLRVLPPLVVAIGTSGAVPNSTREALAAVLMLDVDAGAAEDGGAVENGIFDGELVGVASASDIDARVAVSGSTGSVIRGSSAQSHAALLRTVVAAAGAIGRTRPDAAARIRPSVRLTRRERRKRGAR